MVKQIHSKIYLKPSESKYAESISKMTGAETEVLKGDTFSRVPTRGGGRGSSAPDTSRLEAEAEARRQADRIKAEQDRIKAEQERLKAEQERLKAEKLRIDQQKARDIKEARDRYQAHIRNIQDITERNKATQDYRQEAQEIKDKYGEQKVDAGIITGYTSPSERYSKTQLKKLERLETGITTGLVIGEEKMSQKTAEAYRKILR